MLYQMRLALVALMFCAPRRRDIFMADRLQKEKEELVECVNALTIEHIRF